MQSRSIFCMHYLDSYSGALELQSWRLPIQIKPDYAHSDPIPFLCLDPHSIVWNPFLSTRASTATASEPFHVPHLMTLSPIAPHPSGKPSIQPNQTIPFDTFCLMTACCSSCLQHCSCFNLKAL
eukprot:750065_1